MAQTTVADQESDRGAGSAAVPEAVQPAATEAVDLDQALDDYRTGWRSRHMSLLGRQEVLTGKAKFGIFGDGKEVAQLALARAVMPGDWRSGYYRDQTLMLALGLLTVEQFFAQLYADADLEREPASGGRQMTAHFATALLDEHGAWLPQTDRVNVAADSSPTGSQMPRLVGLTQASVLYRQIEALGDRTSFSLGGNEVVFGTIGNASCAEGPFWESVNAVGVLGGPLVLSIWDDEYGISVSNQDQITKGDLSALLSGFQRGDGDRGYALYTVRGWDYAALLGDYREAAAQARADHVPALIHVVEMTQPLGHSTSGSHERYKSPERLAWEDEHDCLRRMRAWLLAESDATEDQLDAIEGEEQESVRAAQARAFEDFQDPIKSEQATLEALLGRLAQIVPQQAEVEDVTQRLRRNPSPLRRHLMAAASQTLLLTRDQDNPARRALIAWRREQDQAGKLRYSTHLTSESESSALHVPVIAPTFESEDKPIRGFEVVNRCFDAALARIPELIAFGEDVGKLGDVNQGFLGLQEKYGALRVADTGIRECTIMGQAIGAAMRGLRPIAEIQYLDYVLYGLQTLSDDLATLHWRTRGQQKAPVIVRTRGHRLEGVWHAGSPMAGLLNLIRGMYLCVPRDMTQAAGMYNTLLASDDSAIVVEVLNGYRMKEAPPTNIDSFTVPLGMPEVIRSGTDVTLATYGACCRIAQEAAERLADVGIEVEVIDAQTLLPFDREGAIAASLERTSRLVLLDEDVPGGATAYMLQQIVELRGGFHWLDAPPMTITAEAHRPAYGSDGDYWSKPNAESVFEAVYSLMHDSDPARYPIFFR